MWYNASAGSTVQLHSDIHGRTILNGMLADRITNIVDVDNLISKLRACRDIAGVDMNTKTAYPEKRTAVWHTVCGSLIWAGTSDEYKLRKIFIPGVYHFER